MVKTFRARAAIAVLSAAFVSTAALAQEAAASNPFDALDSDHDGVLSSQEGQQHPVVANSFAKADQNADGKLTREEFSAAFTTRQAAAPADAAPQGDTSPSDSPPK